jgi:endonuclease/exonuclease/phosphatase family metal-dependent hydrolase
MKLKTIIFLLLTTSGASCWTQDTTDSLNVIKVLTFNIYHGATMKGDFDLDYIASIIKEADPDLVALQEVDFHTRRARGYDLATELGWRVKMAPLFAPAMAFDGGEYGEGILSRYSFIATKNVPLPSSTEREPRTALEVMVCLPSGDTMVFIGTHLDHLADDTDRVLQARRINEVFGAGRYPAVLAGDFNAVPGSVPIGIFEEVWESTYDGTDPAPTFPSGEPDRKIDYVMYYPRDRWRVLSTEVMHDSVASDHCAYLVTLQLLVN